MTRAALLCPGRGSYTERTLGALPADHAFVRRAEELRRGYGLAPLVELDRARRFDPALHLEPRHASPLIWLVSMLDAERARREHEIACVAGNSMGWYTALAVSGALSFDDGYRLVQELSILQQEQQERTGGGQLLYPLVGDDWRRDEARASAVRDALASAAGEAWPSIHLGGYAVLAGSEDGVARLVKSLPRVQLGKNAYPMRLVQHGPYHTPLAEPVAAAARERLADLAFGPPGATLIDGLGRRFSPWSADSAELARYTLGDQVVRPFDFTLAVRVALREHAPERLVCPGPGNTLGGVCGQILVAEGWRGIRSKADFERVQAGEDPVLVSLGEAAPMRGAPSRALPQEGR